MDCTMSEGTIYLCTSNEKMILSPASTYSSDENVSSTSEPKRRGRKRCLDHLSLEEKILRKKLKNREAAQVSRDRKKARMDQLEYTVDLLIKKNKELEMDLKKNKHRNRELTKEIERLKSEKNTPSEKSTPSEKCTGCSCQKEEPSERKCESKSEALAKLVCNATERPAEGSRGVSSRSDPLSPMSLPDLDLIGSKEEWDWLFESPQLDFSLLENLADDLITMSAESQPAEVEKTEVVGPSSKLVESSCQGECSTDCLNLKTVCKKPCDPPRKEPSKVSNPISQPSKLQNSVVPQLDKSSTKECNSPSKIRKIGIETPGTNSNIQFRRIEKSSAKPVSEPKIVVRPKKVVARLPKILPKVSTLQAPSNQIVNVGSKVCSINEMQNILDIPVIIVEDVGLVEEVSTCTDDAIMPKKEQDYSDCSVEAYCDQVVNNFDATFKVELEDAELEMMREEDLKRLHMDTLGVEGFGKDLSDAHSDHGYDSLDSPLSDNNEYLSLALFPSLLE